jgi:hypothetical protein
MNAAIVDEAAKLECPQDPHEHACQKYYGDVGNLYAPEWYSSRIHVEAENKNGDAKAVIVPPLGQPTASFI